MDIIRRLDLVAITLGTHNVDEVFWTLDDKRYNSHLLYLLMR